MEDNKHNEKHHEHHKHHDNHEHKEESREKDQCCCGEACECKSSDNISDKASEYLELAQRIKAEFDNYKKRNAEITTTSYNNGIAIAVTKILPCIDSFNQAKSNISDPAVLSGVELIYNQLIKGLSELNVVKIDCLGKLFDPNLHNAVLVGSDDAYPEDTVLEEYQAGFTLNGKVIRPSTVKVNKLG